MKISGVGSPLSHPYYIIFESDCLFYSPGTLGEMRKGVFRTTIYSKDNFSVTFACSTRFQLEFILYDPSFFCINLLQINFCIHNIMYLKLINNVYIIVYFVLCLKIHLGFFIWPQSFASILQPTSTSFTSRTTSRFIVS